MVAVANVVVVVPVVVVVSAAVVAGVGVGFPATVPSAVAVLSLLHVERKLLLHLLDHHRLVLHLSA